MRPPELIPFLAALSFAAVHLAGAQQRSAPSPRATAQADLADVYFMLVVVRQLTLLDLR